MRRQDVKTGDNTRAKRMCGATAARLLLLYIIFLEKFRVSNMCLWLTLYMKQYNESKKNCNTTSLQRYSGWLQWLATCNCGGAATRKLPKTVHSKIDTSHSRVHQGFATLAISFFGSSSFSRTRALLSRNLYLQFFGFPHFDCVLFLSRNYYF